MRRFTAVALPVLLVAALALGSVAAPAAASHGEPQANFTVGPGTHDTGAGSVSYELRVELTDTVERSPSFAYPDRIVFLVQGATLDGCASSGGWFGGGTNYELGVNKSTSDGYQFQPYTVGSATWDGNAVAFTFDDDDDGDQPNFRSGDFLELRLDSCVTNAAEDGWYLGGVNVTGGSRTDRTVTFDRLVPSHYFGVCDGCGSDAEARESMGNPPSEPEPTPVPTATPTPAPTPTATPFDPATPTDRPTPTATATPSPTPEATATATGGGGSGLEPVEADVFGMNPFVVVGLVALVSLALAVLGVRRL